MKKLVFLLLPLLVSCGDFLGKPDAPKGNVVFKIVTKSVTGEEMPITELANRINAMVFDSNGNKALSKVLSQTSEDANFGNFGVDLAEGEYIIVLAVHSSLANASFDSPSKISFTLKDGVKVTDTFTDYQKFTVTSAKQTIDLYPIRKTAMVRFVFEDESTPEEVVKFRFKYTGGSANVDPNNYGCTKSTQTEVRLKNGENIYEVFTFPYEAVEGKLNMTVEALDVNETVLKAVNFPSVPITMNQISEYHGKFFAGDINTGSTNFVIHINGDWAGINTYTF